MNSIETTPAPHCPSSTRANDNEDTPRKIKRRILSQTKLIHKKTEQTRRLKTKKISSEDAFLAASSYISSNFFCTILKMQMFHKKRTPWSEEEKQAALELYYRSPSLYTVLKEDKHVILPDKRTISKWMNVIDIMPGVSEDLLEPLKMKVQTMEPMDKNVVLMFDEMAIKKCLSYNEKRDVVEGFEDLGRLGRTNKIGTHALLFMIRGLFKNWKMPIAYFIDHNTVNGEKLAELIKCVLSAVIDIGLQVRVLVCDQGKNNTKAISLLPVTTANPYFTHHGQTIHVMYDTPHLIKCVRNNMLRCDIEFEGGTASWGHVRHLYEIDTSSKKARALCKLSGRHINPNNFEKMKVKLATQVFSRTVKAAMQTAVETEQLPEEAAQTAVFIGELNDIFDCLNSRQLYDSNPLKCAISEATYQGKEVIQKLRAAVPWIKTWRKDTSSYNGTGDHRKIQTIPPSFSGFLLTINSVLSLWESLKNDETKFLLTNRLTQDAIEHEFSISRQRGGFDRNPSAMKFRQNLRHRMLISMMKPPSTSNCETSEEVPILPQEEAAQNPMSDTDEEEDADEGKPIDGPPELDVKQLEDDEASDAEYEYLQLAPPLTAKIHTAEAEQTDSNVTLETCSIQ